MGTRTVNTAAGTVTQEREQKPHNDYDDRLTRFRTSVAVFRTMMKNGTLSEADYKKSCDVLADKYGISLCSIFR